MSLELALAAGDLDDAGQVVGGEPTSLQEQQSSMHPSTNHIVGVILGGRGEGGGEGGRERGR